MTNNKGPLDQTHGVPLAGDRPSEGSKLINKIIFLALGLIFFALAILFYWATADDKPLDIRNAPLPSRTIRKHPTGGGVIILTVDYCKNIDVEGTLRISFVSDSREIFQPAIPEQSPKGCSKKEHPVLLPENMPAGTYRIKFRATYDLNPLKKGVSQDFESVPVEIDPKSTTNTPSEM